MHALGCTGAGLNGPIPSFASCRHLRKLWLYKNEFEGTRAWRANEHERNFRADCNVWCDV